ncbi:acyl-CoA dehydrogenase family protein [Aquihabitans sp. McL0605]|uniref:acyl-CoA dehydrogenase family protein n=1 Tax=Aquihabitans sp. McL0605 TaxID=3415671 RepID=UPI003CEC3C86
MDADDLELFERTIGHAVAAADPALLGADLDDALHDLGWLDALADDDRAAVSVLFEQLGRNHATCAALDFLVTGGEHGVVLPWLGAVDPPGRLDGDRLRVRGLATERILRQDTVFVPCALAADEAAPHDAVAGVVVAAADLTLRPVTGLDPDLGLVTVTAVVDGLDPTAAHPLAWADTIAVAQLAVGHQLVGASRKMLELAREHALERVQFGQPISGFQAIRHRLAEALIAIESAQALLDGAWDDRHPVTAAMAKAAAGRAARTTARHAQQVLAGIGFTTEHDLHLYVRRTLALDELFGSTRTLTADLGRAVTESRQLPPLLPL